MTTDRATYQRDLRHQLRGMLKMYQAQLDAKMTDDFPFDMDQIADMLAQDVKELELVQAKFLLAVCSLLRSEEP
jgi:hypothetical protein